MTRPDTRSAHAQAEAYSSPELQSVARNEPPRSLQELKTLDQESRRVWMRGWMERMGLPNANQAAPLLSLTRQTVEKMLYPNRRQNSAVGDQTLHIAYLLEQPRKRSCG